MSDENDTIKIIDRRRLYLDDEGDVQEREPDERIVRVGHSVAEGDLDEGESGQSGPAQDGEQRKQSWWRRLRNKFSRSSDR